MFLLDTHTLIWTILEDDKITDSTKEILISSDNLFVSIASLWEIAIKQSIGKLDIIYSIERIADESVKNEIKILDIKPRHLDAIRTLPPIHNDPFDRLIIAQAMTEGMKIITKDGMIPKYDIETIW